MPCDHECAQLVIDIVDGQYQMGHMHGQGIHSFDHTVHIGGPEADREEVTYIGSIHIDHIE